MRATLSVVSMLVPTGISSLTLIMPWSCFGMISTVRACLAKNPTRAIVHPSASTWKITPGTERQNESVLR